MEKGADLGRANVDRGPETRSTDFTLREGFRRLTHEFAHGAQAFGNGVGDIALMKEVTNKYQASLHLCEVADGFPAHGIVDVEQRALPALEARVLGHFFTEALPRTLKIGQDGFLVEGRLGIESHLLGRLFADNPGWFGCLQAVGKGRGLIGN